MQIQDIRRTIDSFLRPQQRFDQLGQYEYALKSHEQSEKQMIRKMIQNLTPFQRKALAMTSFMPDEHVVFLSSLHQHADTNPIVELCLENYLKFIESFRIKWKKDSSIQLFGKDTLSLKSPHHVHPVSITFVVFTYRHQLMCIILYRGKLLRVDIFKPAMTSTKRVTSSTKDDIPKTMTRKQLKKSLHRL